MISSLYSREATTNVTSAPQLELIPMSNFTPEHCDQRALMDAFGIFIQGILAFLAFTSLILKRFCEPKLHRRPWKIWFYDTSKQALGALVIHFANVFLATIFQGDPCTWYFVSFLLDSTIGLLIIILSLKTIQYCAKKYKWSSLYFGEYGKPPLWHKWLSQCAVYITIMFIEKLLITLLIQLQFWHDVRQFILSPIKDKKLEVAIVMLIVPFFINALMFWVVDNYLMKKHKSDKHDNLSRTDFKIIYRKSNRIGENSEAEVLLSQDEEELLYERDLNIVQQRHLSVSS